MPAEIETDRITRRLTLFFWATAIVLFAVEAWTMRFEMSFDGIQYLDDAAAYLRGDWKNAANSQWSPGYVWLEAAMLRIFQPSSYWEFPLIHLLNFFLAIGSMCAFQFFLSTALRGLKVNYRPLRWVVVVVGYVSFLYVTLDFTNLSIVTPDLLVCPFVFLVAGMLAEVGMGERRLSRLLLLGLTLGFGYLAKAPFFVYSFFCFVILAVMLVGSSRWWLRFGAVLLGFVVVAGPYIAFLSHWKHRLTYGDSGSYNVVWMVNGLPYTHWQGEIPGLGKPLHPTRQLMKDPPVYEFATPIAGTYPPWFDPIYWNQGAKAQYRIGLFAAAVVRAVRTYEYWLHHHQLSLVCGFLILLVLAPSKWNLMTSLATQWPVIAFGLFPFALYSLVHIDPRFFVAFFVLLWVSLAIAVVQAFPESEARVVRVVAAVMGALMMIECVSVSIPTPPLHGLQTAVASRQTGHLHWELAQDIAALGIRPGDPVAIVGKDFPYFWAHLAGVHIVSEVVWSAEGDCGADANRSRRAQWESARPALAATGAKILISPCIQGVVDQPGWVELGRTGVFAYRF
jgi:hypothetical protein